VFEQNNKSEKQDFKSIRPEKKKQRILYFIVHLVFNKKENFSEEHNVKEKLKVMVPNISLIG
jgi:hypothetical protein